MNKGRSTPEGTGSITPRERDTYFEVPYALENISKCRCPLCPVQADSRCAQDILESLKEAMENISGEKIPNPEEVPGVYCSTGKSVCQDLNPDRRCICYSCDVWKEYDLEGGRPSQYFCQNGKAT